MPDYTRYGLTVNPYRTRELDPLCNPHDEARLAEVDGLSTHKQVIEEALQAAIAARRAAFFLVAGGSGTGRSTVANWIISRYARYLGLAPERMLVPNRSVVSNDDFDTLLNWFAFLDNRIDDVDDISLGPIVDETLARLVDVARRETMVPTFAKTARLVNKALRSQKDSNGKTRPAAYAVCLEGVNVYSIVRAVLDVFEEVPTVAVFTTFGLENVGKDVVGLFRQTKGDFRQVVQLGPLTATEVALVLEKRWRESSQHPDEPPFDRDALVQTLGRSPRPLGRILVLMSRLIDIKLAEYDGQCAWPQNTGLKLTPQQIEQHLVVLEADYGL